MRVRWAHCVQTVTLLACLSFNTASYGEGFEQKELDEFVDTMVQQEGFSRNALRPLFDKVEFQPRIIELMSRPAEKSLTWAEYRTLLINDRRVAAGAAFWQKNRAILTRAQEKYGVPIPIILGILGIETSFGQNTGSFRVIDALSTLGFAYPKRASFFKKELKEFLLLTREQKFDSLQLTGSYAGAMGLPQFMPSSYRAYAVDFDGSGQADIWNSFADAIGSIAAYLSRHGWAEGAPIAVQASVSGPQYEKFISSTARPKETIDQARKLGWKAAQPPAAGTKVRGLRLTGRDGEEHWLTLNNFYVITRYNKSDLYAMAVYQLGQDIEKKLGQNKQKGAGRRD